MPEPAIIAQPQFEYNASIDSSFAKDLARLRASYEFEDADDIAEYLKNHLGLIPLLLEAISPIREAFGTEPKLQLRTMSDWHDCWLSAGILWTGSTEAARKARDHFDESWWLNQSSEAKADLVINYWFA